MVLEEHKAEDQDKTKRAAVHIKSLPSFSSNKRVKIQSSAESAFKTEDIFQVVDLEPSCQELKLKYTPSFGFPSAQYKQQAPPPPPIFITEDIRLSQQAIKASGGEQGSLSPQHTSGNISQVIVERKVKCNCHKNNCTQGYQQHSVFLELEGKQVFRSNIVIQGKIS